MEHIISVNIEAGICDRLMGRMRLEDAMQELKSKAPLKKEECWLMSNGYSISTSRYERLEGNFQWIDTILLDVDNKESNPNLLKEFQDEYSEYEYWLWETASSTNDCPKFRVILPMDRRVEWINQPSKITKQAIKNHFKKYTDDKASWYFSPTAGKLNTLMHHEGKEYPSSEIEKEIMIAQHINAATSLNALISNALGRRMGISNDGWRNLPSVKKCLDGLHVGERDSSLNAACYAMKQNGYKDKIPQFLDEVACDRSIKDKFRNRYR